MASLASRLDQPASEVITMVLELPRVELIVREAGSTARWLVGYLGSHVRFRWKIVFWEKHGHMCDVRFSPILDLHQQAVY